MSFSTRKILGMMVSVIALSTQPVHSDPLSQAINTEIATENAAIQSQKKIDQLSDQTRSMLEQYRVASRQAETLQAYNHHMQDLLASQQQEKLSLQQQLQDIDVTQQEMLPLVLNMLKNLEAFIALDLPFLPDERQQRVAKLKDMMVRADVTHAEKFRRILEAYQIENDYGNTIEAYRDDLNMNGQTSAVDFFRLGRVALYYQRLDGSETGYWDNQNKQWQVLSSDYRVAIQNGLRMARKESAPDLIVVPVAAAEAIQ